MAPSKCGEAPYLPAAPTYGGALATIPGYCLTIGVPKRGEAPCLLLGAHTKWRPLPPHLLSVYPSAPPKIGEVPCLAGGTQGGALCRRLRSLPNQWRLLNATASHGHWTASQVQRRSKCTRAANLISSLTAPLPSAHPGASQTQRHPLLLDFSQRAAAPLPHWHSGRLKEAPCVYLTTPGCVYRSG